MSNNFTAERTGYFITFEGVDGVGKSTQVTLLQKYLEENSGREVVTSFEPGGTKLGEKLREIVLFGKDLNLDFKTETLLYLTNRANHVETLIKPALDAGKIVIGDRFMDSTFAYQINGRNIKSTASAAFFTELADWVTSHITPDITFLLDMDPVKSKKRIAGGFDRIEEAGESFFNETRNTFLDIAKQNPNRVVIINADQSTSEIHKQIIANEKLREALKCLR